MTALIRQIGHLFPPACPRRGALAAVAAFLSGAVALAAAVVLPLAMTGRSVPDSLLVAASPTPLAIRVSGSQLVDGAGSPVVLRGADVSGTEFSCIQGGTPTNRGWSIYGGQPLDQLSTFQAMASWGMNAVRVPLNEDCWLAINGVNPSYGGANYQAAIRREVSLIHQAGMYAILDLHWSSPGNYAAYNQQPMADADHSITFWQSVASAFKSDPADIFDFYNEPYFYWISDSSDQWSCWMNGCQMNQFVTSGQTGPNGQSTGYITSYSWKTAGMQQLVDAVRSTGATQPVLVNGADWGNDDSGWTAPTDPQHQTIVGWHSYPGESCDTSTCWNSTIAHLAQHYPVLVGETGDSSAGPETYLPTFLPWADAHGLSYLAWTWNPWQNDSNVLIQDWSGTPTTGEGQYYKSHLASLGSAHTTPPSSRAGTTPGAARDAAGDELVATTAPDSSVQVASRTATGTWSSAQDLGGVALGGPTVVSPAIGQWAVIVRGANNAVWVKTYTKGAWTGWSSLGGITTAKPGAAASGTHVDVAIRAATGAVQTRTLSPGSAWTNLGGVLKAGTGPAAAFTAPGNLAVAGQGLDGALWIRTAGTWSSLGSPDNHRITQEPAVSSVAAGELETFARSSADNATWHRLWHATTGWTPWYTLGGVISTGPAAAAAQGNPNQDVYSLGTDNKLWAITDTDRAWGTWTKVP